MKNNKQKAMKLWESRYGNSFYAEDFGGNLMCREGYGKRNYNRLINGNPIYCGWNIHHILPKAKGGTNAQSNLLCTNFATNLEAGDRTTYWINDHRYQVQKCAGRHDIIRLN